MPLPLGLSTYYVSSTRPLSHLLQCVVAPSKFIPYKRNNQTKRKSAPACMSPNQPTNDDILLNSHVIPKRNKLYKQHSIRSAVFRLQNRPQPRNRHLLAYQSFIAKFNKQQPEQIHLYTTNYFKCYSTQVVSKMLLKNTPTLRITSLPNGSLDFSQANHHQMREDHG